MIYYSIYWTLLILIYFGLAKLILYGLSEKQFVDVMSSPILVRYRSRSFKKAEIIAIGTSLLLIPILTSFLFNIAIHIQEGIIGLDGLVFFQGREAVWVSIVLANMASGFLLIMLAARFGDPLPESRWKRQPMYWEVREYARRFKFIALAMAFVLQFMFLINIAAFIRIDDAGISHRAQGLFFTKHYPYDQMTKASFKKQVKVNEQLRTEADFILYIDKARISLWNAELNYERNIENIKQVVNFLEEIKTKQVELSFEIENWPPKNSS